MTDPIRVDSPTARYWVLVGVLIPFGVITGFSIGIPFLLLGLMLLVLAPVRYHPTMFWPPLAAYVALVAGFISFAPLSCSSYSTDGIEGPTTCERILGADGEGFTTAWTTGVVAAAVAGVATWFVIARRQSATASSESHPLGK